VRVVKVPIALSPATLALPMSGDFLPLFGGLRLLGLAHLAAVAAAGATAVVPAAAAVVAGAR
jgi:hypothetical protein